MKINRLICALIIIGCGVFASYYGGNIPYALFYLSILIPIIAFLYTVYVYFQFKIYQSMNNYLVVKGDWTEYSFVIANEDYVTFRNVKVNFLSDKSKIEDTGQSTEYSLLPNESEKMETRIKCNYRGEYYVGVDSIEVTDFLYLFTITYPLSSKLKVVVLPRVVPLEQLGIAPPQVDVKNPIRHSNQTEEELDTELRNYNQGDNKKRIHWKATAKVHELMSRKYYHRPKAEIVLYMDLRKVKEEELQVVAIEDKIIESVLAIANYYALRGIASHIIYDMEGRKQINISSKEEFNAFYKTCAKLNFIAKEPVQDMIMDKIVRGEEGMFVVAATHLLTKEVYLTALKVMAGGNHLCILFISDDVSEVTKELINGIRMSGAYIYQIMSEDEIGDILSKEVLS
ncbi:DUF58 domain-containing protein [Mobilitalea sibirica]|uniref:DUF58 domain-containing protein n=1 Tax=Mobilitalea sibirica TaxID=1462919 RepID=A0A8J7KW78_9FIRM|nr:DUF58 domain-containing protein [Mobilitalea sibirica]MBH1941035.1 DUF58 domain-containing protein [Mobilitalea sibirica]